MEVPKYFEALPDFRVQGRCLHKLSDIVMLVLVGFIADCEDFEEVEDFGNDKKAYLQTFLELSNGIPSHDTMSRVFRAEAHNYVESGHKRGNVVITHSMEGEVVRPDTAGKA